MGAILSKPYEHGLTGLLLGEQIISEVQKAMRELQVKGLTRPSSPIKVTPSSCSSDMCKTIEGAVGVRWHYVMGVIAPCCCTCVPVAPTAMFCWDGANEDAPDTIARAVKHLQHIAPQGVKVLPVQTVEWLQATVNLGHKTIEIKPSKTDYIFVTGVAWAKCKEDFGAKLFNGWKLSVKDGMMTADALQSMLGSIIALYEVKTDVTLNKGLPGVRVQALIEYLAVNHMKDWPMNDVPVLFGDLNRHYVVHAGRKDAGQPQRSIHVEAARENEYAQALGALFRLPEVYEALGLTKPPTCFQPVTKEEYLAGFRPYARGVEPILTASLKLTPYLFHTSIMLSSSQGSMSGTLVVLARRASSSLTTMSNPLAAARGAPCTRTGAHCWLLLVNSYATEHSTEHATSSPCKEQHITQNAGVGIGCSKKLFQAIMASVRGARLEPARRQGQAPGALQLTPIERAYNNSAVCFYEDPADKKLKLHILWDELKSQKLADCQWLGGPKGKGYAELTNAFGDTTYGDLEARPLQYYSSTVVPFRRMLSTHAQLSLDRAQRDGKMAGSWTFQDYHSIENVLTWLQTAELQEPPIAGSMSELSEVMSMSSAPAAL
ncbi:hypothetical protein VOLCADRAFT_107945 [Volvox carteri f. nagariensis]|uniref:Uncharacterized protein n=1 Tax=Volvox carteri f. nagariensis TaxID=3068 RepID=D8UHC4_VOLCA|nr:uncharacterized protein VOLCADRAFT_107945 [Volvox carteri f. nagariensis]EFJ40881.1 hypothetical protein VOLCADRAFT_107945 [Volvox carteri f. nagariensis]|eukprot:XP_002958041.1 hypothetical protein VOLCADRAFT_107945 [Volvox carteri f. nagariensis]